MFSRRYTYPLLVLAAAALLWWGRKEGYLEEPPEPKSSTPSPSPWSPEPPPPGRGGPPVMSPPPVVPREPSPRKEVKKGEAPPLLLPGTVILDPRAWPWEGPGVPGLEAAKRLARIRWTPPRPPLAGEEKVPDPDGIGPCPPRKLPPGRRDTPVVRRYIDRRTFEPTWVHADGSLTSLNVAVVEIPGKGKERVVQILTKYR